MNLKTDLVVNPMFEMSFFATDTVRARIDITAWSYEGKAVGRGIDAWLDIDPMNDWVIIKENIVNALNTEVGTDWYALRSIEIRLYDERGLFQSVYKRDPCEIFLDDFSLYSGDPNEIITYEESTDAYEFPSFEFLTIPIVFLILYKRRQKPEEAE